MNLNPGQTVGIVNHATDLRKWDPSKQRRLYIHEVNEYKGQLIILGSTPSAEQHVPLHGFITAPAQRSSPIILRGETDINICRLTEYLRGKPLSLVQGDQLLLFVNCATRGTDGAQTEVWRGLDERKQQDHALKSARVIDLWLEMKADGRLAKLEPRRDMRFDAAGRLQPFGKNRSLWAPSDYIKPAVGPTAPQHDTVVMPSAFGFNPN